MAVRRSKRAGAVTFVRGCVIEKDYVYLDTRLDSLDRDQHYARMFLFDEQIAEDTKKFYFHDLPDWRVVSVCMQPAGAASLRRTCALSEMGEVNYCDVDGGTQDRIPGAGLPTPAAPGRGYVSRIRAIGERLYVCGSNGQMYRRDGKAWQNFDEGLLTGAAVTDDALALLHGGDPDALSNLFDDMVMLNDVNGVSETDLYTVGDQGRIFHSSGGAWEPVAAPVHETLTAIHCANAGEVWICGYHGTVLRGNWQDGFIRVAPSRSKRHFYSVDEFDGLVYLADGNAAYTLHNGKLTRLKTGLQPEVKDVHHLEARDGRLWLFAYKDLAYFDGLEWTRVVFLANDPLS